MSARFLLWPPTPRPGFDWFALESTAPVEVIDRANSLRHQSMGLATAAPATYAPHAAAYARAANDLLAQATGGRSLVVDRAFVSTWRVPKPGPGSGFVERSEPSALFELAAAMMAAAACAQQAGDFAAALEWLGTLRRRVPVVFRTGGRHGYPLVFSPDWTGAIMLAVAGQQAIERARAPGLSPLAAAAHSLKGASLMRKAAGVLPWSRDLALADAKAAAIAYIRVADMLVDTDCGVAEALARTAARRMTLAHTGLPDAGASAAPFIRRAEAIGDDNRLVHGCQRVPLVVKLDLGKAGVDPPGVSIISNSPQGAWVRVTVPAAEEK